MWRKSGVERSLRLLWNRRVGIAANIIPGGVLGQVFRAVVWLPDAVFPLRFFRPHFLPVFLQPFYDQVVVDFLAVVVAPVAGVAVAAVAPVDTVSTLDILNGMTTYVKKWGNSLAIRIPKHLSDSLNLKEGSPLSFVASSSQILIKPLKDRKNELAISFQRAVKDSMMKKIANAGLADYLDQLASLD